MLHLYHKAKSWTLFRPALCLFLLGGTVFFSALTVSLNTGPQHVNQCRERIIPTLLHCLSFLENGEMNELRRFLQQFTENVTGDEMYAQETSRIRNLTLVASGEARTGTTPMPAAD